jgi:hypothetical protein
VEIEVSTHDVRDCFSFDFTFRPLVLVVDADVNQI